MNKISKNEKGFSAVEAVLVLVIVILIGVVGWLVYDKHHDKIATTASDTQPTSTTTKTTKSTTTTSTTTSSPKEVNYTSWSTVPSDMQTELLAEWKSVAPNGCQPGDSYQTDAESGVTSQEPLVTYGDQFMMHGFGCDGGAIYILAKQSGTWQSIGSSQDGWDCSLIQKYSIPTSLLQADNVVENGGQGSGLPVTCVDSSGATQTLAS